MVEPVVQLGAPSAEELCRWKAFVSDLTKDVLSCFWEELVRIFPDAPLPIVYEGEEESSLLLVWDNDRRRLDADLLPSGAIHWFYKDRVTGKVEGTDDQPSDTIPDDFVAHLRQM